MAQRYQRIFASILLVLLSPQLLFGWSEGGHNVIGFLAFKGMSPEKREKFIEIIEHHSINQRSSAGGLLDASSEWGKEGKVKLTVYTPEVLRWVEGDRTEPLELSENYLKTAGGFALLRAKKAGERLAMIWSESL